MFDLRRLLAIAVMFFGLGFILPGQAHAFDLTGAWATNAELCNRVFTKKQNQVVFSEMSDLYGSGFIIDGDRIRGKAARCAIKSRKEDGDTINLSAACSTSIMNSSAQFTVKVIDANSFARVFPDIEGMTLNYYRCSVQ